MKLDIYQVDAFTKTLFKGNPAAIVPLKEWISDAQMQSIAAENNLAETAFIVHEKKGFRIRWFTPAVEVDLCGHATLAAAYLYFKELGYSENTIIFNSKSGPLSVNWADEVLFLDFPTDVISSTPLPENLEKALGASITNCIKGKTDILVELPSQSAIEALTPDFRLLSTIKARGIIATAKGDKVDFVSRFFAPQSGIDEDPVTGSAHTTLIPYWAEKLNKNQMNALQLSKRGGELRCELRNNRVLIGGNAVLYLKGEIYI